MKKTILLMLVCCMQLTVMAQAVNGKKTVHRKHHVTAHQKASPAVKWKKHGNTTTVAKDDHAAYEGKPSQSNDGVNKNKQRNINTNVPVQLAPGNNSR